MKYVPKADFIRVDAFSDVCDLKHNLYVVVDRSGGELKHFKVSIDSSVSNAPKKKRKKTKRMKKLEMTFPVEKIPGKEKNAERCAQVHATLAMIGMRDIP